jgi:hypothetical protein
MCVITRNIRQGPGIQPSAGHWFYIIYSNQGRIDSLSVYISKTETCTNIVLKVA